MGGYDDFLRGWNDVHNPNYDGPHIFEEYFGVFPLFMALSMLGLLVYMLSRENVEDEYINALRLESYQLTTPLGISLSLIGYLLSQVSHQYKFMQPVDI